MRGGVGAQKADMQRRRWQVGWGRSLSRGFLAQYRFQGSVCKCVPPPPAAATANVPSPSPSTEWSSSHPD